MSVCFDGLHVFKRILVMNKLISFTDFNDDDTGDDDFYVNVLLLCDYY